MAWATSSLPVPVSPRISTEESVGATCSTWRRTFWMAALCPVTSPCGVDDPDLGLEVVALRLEPVLQPLDFRERLPQGLLGRLRSVMSRSTPYVRTARPVASRAMTRATW